MNDCISQIKIECETRSMDMKKLSTNEDRIN